MTDRPRSGGDPAAPVVGRGPLAPVPERAAAGRPGRRGQPERRDRPGVAYLAYDVALSRGADLPGGDLRTLAVAVYVVLVLVIGSARHVPRRPAADRLRDTVARAARWSAALGFFAAVPIAYLVLVVAVQVIRPLFG